MSDTITTIFETVFRTMNAEGVDYIVVGGVAVNLHGYPRFSADLDILLLLEKENIKKFQRAMHSLGYAEQLPVSVMDLTNQEQVQEWIENKNMKAFSLKPPTGNPMFIDIVVAESLDFASFKKNSENKPMKDIDIPAVSINDLIKMKEASGRSQDNADIEALKELQSL